MAGSDLSGQRLAGVALLPRRAFSCPSRAHYLCCSLWHCLPTIYCSKQQQACLAYHLLPPLLSSACLPAILHACALRRTRASRLSAWRRQTLLPRITPATPRLHAPRSIALILVYRHSLSRGLPFASWTAVAASPGGRQARTCRKRHFPSS